MVDEVDLRIINELLRNARATFREVALKIGLSDVAVMRRIKKLESGGVILKYVTVVNPVEIGYSKISYTGINVKPERLIDVINELKAKEYVKYLAVTSGDHELLAVIWARDCDELVAIHEEIKRIDGVIQVYPAIVADVVKNEAYY